MAYRIEYDTQNQKYEIIVKRPPKLSTLVAGMLTLFLILTCLFWPEGAAVLRDTVIPGEDEVTIHAIECLVEEIHGGVCASEAITNFCREIIYGASSSD